MLEVAGQDDPLIYRMTVWWGCADCRTLGSGGLQPTTNLSGCSTSWSLSPLCICNTFVTSHPLCLKWPAATWHTGAMSQVFLVSDPELDRPEASNCLLNDALSDTVGFWKARSRRACIRNNCCVATAGWPVAGQCPRPAHHCWKVGFRLWRCSRRSHIPAAWLRKQA